MKLLNDIQKWKQLAIIKTPRLSKAATREAKGNCLADAVASQAALNRQITQTRECSLLQNKQTNEETSFTVLTGRCRGKQNTATKGGPLSQANRHGWTQSETNLTYRSLITYTEL